MNSIPGLLVPDLAQSQTHNLTTGSGSNIDGQSSAGVDAAGNLPTRSIHLAPYSEFRFEAGIHSPFRIKLFSGTAELFGTELAPTRTYSFGGRDDGKSGSGCVWAGQKAAIYTWNGCEINIEGTADSEYVAEETEMWSRCNLHFALENIRDAAKLGEVRSAMGIPGFGPCVLVLGPENAGKTSLVKTLTAYALKNDRKPIVVNLDPKQGMLSVPGSLTAVTFSTTLDIEDGWGSSPISGPSTTSVKMPLVYHYGLSGPEENPDIFKPQVTRLALAVTGRMEEDIEVKQSGCIIDTPGSISSGKGGVYDIVHHIVSEFSVNVIVTIGSERLYNDMSKRYSNPPADREPISVVKLQRSEGCVDRDEGYMKLLRASQIRTYFFGKSISSPLFHFTITVDFGSVCIYRIIEANRYGHDVSKHFMPGKDNDTDQLSCTTPILYEKTAPIPAMQNSVLAILHANPDDNQESLRDSNVLGYVYVSDVDEAKRRLTLLSPLGGRLPVRAIVWGKWLDDVVNLTV